MDQVDLMDQMDKIGAPLNNPWVCVAAVWIGSGADLPQGLRCRSVEWLGRRFTAEQCNVQTYRRGMRAA